jgi:hypothetical protein
MFDYAHLTVVHLRAARRWLAGVRFPHPNITPAAGMVEWT